mmetsp:Transcript_4459/g.10459  ORF Transcript_4459/g.10459 Transcript_4459/m.10459 type:complete len:270 (-) Transcript_4459:94-903(-)|eukprot:CAMPEP_0171109120 /NCGR_PEP_ID=MMETSP0766_2-20121228/70317_1 /TAXON_ID=439317 /ORGANISM="Gambierdiscus australes, Strain CAWD 149" /LENGTH=269 /DNA_ID=CAMNT_0011570793 /DNA_START=53 /DNA_END=862 /DNA_ORIENTATION=+
MGDANSPNALSGSPPNPQAVADASAGSAEPHLTFSLDIKKTAGTSLGINVTYSSTAPWTRNGVFITRVVDNGMVAAWNAKSPEPKCVQAGDFIFQVNNIHGDTPSMINELKVKQELTLWVMRRPPAQQLTMADEIALEPGAETREAGASEGEAVPPLEAEPVASAAVPGAELVVAAAPVEVPLPDAVEAGGCGAGGCGPPEDDIRGSVEAGGEPTRSSPEDVEQLSLQLAELTDETLAGLICVVLQERPHLRDAVLGPDPESEASDGGG